jgi:hexosaminidase
MTATRPRLLSGILLLCSAAWAAEHRPLLPQPESIQYGQGQLGVNGLSIQVGGESSEEDRFAAAALADGIASQTGLKLSSGATAETGRRILLDRTGGVDALPVPGEKPGPDSREAYRLSINAKGVEISGRSSAAIYYGVQTLLQLVEGAGKTAYFPDVDIHDWPSLAYRGTLVDVGSEGPMSTEGEVEQQLDFLARWKGNQFYLYSEAGIELDGYPLLNPDARFSKDQIRQIIAYGRARHIDVVPAVELYGHLHDLFRIEKYSDLADFPHGGEFNPANPKVKVLLDDWISQLAALFPSPFVLVGFDETWTIQKAAEKSGESATPVQLFVAQLTHVTKEFQARNKTVMAYADIMVKFPGIIPNLPPGLIAVPWYYDASPDPEYKYWLDPLVAHHVPQMVASGVSSWVEIAPDFDKTFTNIDTLLAAGRKAQTMGLINTVWTDDNQVLLRMSWPGITYGAVAAWQSHPVDRTRFFASYAQTVYPPAAANDMAQALTALNTAEVSLQKAVGVSTMAAAWKNPFAPATLAAMNSQRETLREVRLQAEDAQEHLMHAVSAGAGKMNTASFLIGARLLDYVGMKYIYALEMNDLWATLPKSPDHKQLREALTVGIYNSCHSRLADLMDAVTQLREAYREAWLSQYTSYRLGTALGRWAAEYEYWRRAQARFETFADDYHDGQPLPPLREVIEGQHHE